MDHVGYAPRRGSQVDRKICCTCLENGGNGHKELFFTVKSYRNKFIRLHFFIFDERYCQLIRQAVKLFIGKASVLICYSHVSRVFFYLFLKKVQPGKGLIILQLRSL